MDLSEIRTQIDAIDQELIGLFCRRMELTQNVARYKKENNLPIFQPGRETAVLERAQALAGERWGTEARALLASIMDMSKSAQHAQLFSSDAFRGLLGTTETFPSKARVCCQGVEGAYSHHACRRMFPEPSITFVPQFEDVFRQVESGAFDFGVLPIENSTAGSVSAIYDLMARYRFTIARSAKIRIEHCLLARPGVSLEEITDVYTHEQAISQCSQWLRDHPAIRVHSYANTAAAAQYVAQCGEPGAAAISSMECAELYNLNCLEQGIQSAKSNYTRFICITREPTVFAPADKISVMLAIPHRAGSLYRVLSRFAYHNINLTKLESRPIPDTDFEFLFYFDFDAPQDLAGAAQVLEELQGELERFTFLGAYTEVE